MDKTCEVPHTARSHSTTNIAVSLITDPNNGWRHVIHENDNKTKSTPQTAESLLTIAT